MIELNSRQRKLLTSYAQTIKPVVQIGQNGLTDGVIEKVNQSLNAHELIKVKFLEFKDEKKELTAELDQACDATLVRIIGNIAVLYRPAEKVDERKFESLLANLR